MGLVDTIDEQLILEQLIESSKPPVPESKKKKTYHYLIQTAFRYPPLEHGSRFGVNTEPGIFYASLDIQTALAETAFYRRLFWQGMESPPPGKRIVTAHTSFEVTLSTKLAIRLEGRPFSRHQTLLTHTADYQATQKLGALMREAGVEAFTFQSAREQGLNVGIFIIDAIINKAPKHLQQWACTTMETGVTFINQNEPGRRYSFQAPVV